MFSLYWPAFGQLVGILESNFGAMKNVGGGRSFQYWFGINGTQMNTDRFMVLIKCKVLLMLYKHAEFNVIYLSGFFDSCYFHQMLQQTCFQWSVAMNRN